MDRLVSIRVYCYEDRSVPWQDHTRKVIVRGHVVPWASLAHHCEAYPLSSYFQFSNASEHAFSKPPATCQHALGSPCAFRTTHPCSPTCRCRYHPRDTISHIPAQHQEVKKKRESTKRKNARYFYTVCGLSLADRLTNQALGWQISTRFHIRPGSAKDLR